MQGPLCNDLCLDSLPSVSKQVSIFSERSRRPRRILRCVCIRLI